MKKGIVIGIIIGAIIFGSIGVYATITYRSDQIIYKNKTVEKALDELYSKNSKSKLCKRAMELHSDGTHTFGNLGTSGALVSGDAYDCDVNGDGYYSPNTERFYYVSNYYNTTTKEFESDTVVLIYYNDTSGGVANNTTTYAYYDSANENWHGPDKAKSQLPTTSQWSNTSLKNTRRAILNETGGNTTTGGTLLSSYSYEGYAARLLTVQEVNSACNITVGSSTKGELDTCQYLMENTKFSSSSMGTYGYWLETPRSNTSDTAWLVYSDYRHVSTSFANYTSAYGVRPAIDVPISDIEY